MPKRKGQLQANVEVVHRPTGTRGRVFPAEGDAPGIVRCVVDSFPLYWICAYGEWPPGPGDLVCWEREDLLVVTDKACQHCYGTGKIVLAAGK